MFHNSQATGAGSDYRHQTAELTRDVPAVVIPDGMSIMLNEGDRVTIQQYLGGTFTVVTEPGYYMVRIGAEHADALGIELDDEDRPKTPEELLGDKRDKDSIEFAVWEQMRTCYDPEIPVNIVDLGLIYECDIHEREEGGFRVEIEMTLTAPGCGMGPVLQGDVETRVKAIPSVEEVDVKVVFDPPWTHDMLSEAAKLELGLW